MMINKRLIGRVSESKKYIAYNVVLQWCALAANIVMMFSITEYLTRLVADSANSGILMRTAIVVLFALSVRFLCTTGVPFFQSC